MEQKKKCRICKDEKTLIHFFKKTGGSLGVQNTCKECEKIQKTKYYEDNKEHILDISKEYNSRPEIKEKNKEHYINNRDEKLKYGSRHWFKNKKLLTEKRKVYYKENYNNILIHNNEYTRNKWANDPEWRMKKMFRVRFHTVLKRYHVAGKESSLKYMGCSPSEYTSYLEEQFLPEMNWNNHGIIWEIDHIIPIASFDFSDEEQIKQCFHFSNHQPLFSTTEIANSFGYKDYIGNKNKQDKIIQNAIY